MMTTMTNDDDGGDGATGDKVDDDGDGAMDDDNDDDDDGGDNNDGNGATGDGSWICCRRVLQNSQTDHVLTIVAHTMTAKLNRRRDVPLYVFVSDINFMSAIFGQNEKYVFYHIVLFVFVFLCF